MEAPITQLFETRYERNEKIISFFAFRESNYHYICTKITVNLNQSHLNLNIMALDDLISLEFSDAEVTKIDQSLTDIETVLAGKVIALQPEERIQFGKVGENTQVWISKISGYMVSKPELVPAFINVAEFEKDLKARMCIMPRIARLNAVVNGMEDTAILLGTDLYNSAIAYYRNIKLLSQQNVPGAKMIYEDLNQKFPGKPKAVKEKNV